MYVSKKTIKLMASKIIGGREADDAVLEWFNNRVDYGPDYNLVPTKTMTNWELYCQIKGNCTHEQFDKSLLEAFGYLEYRMKGEFGALLIDFPEGYARTVEEFMESVRSDFTSMLYECHH